MLLEDKIVLVTGSTGCIGSAIAKKFEKEGAKVMYHGEYQGKETPCYSCDLNEMDNCKKLIDQTLDTYGDLDILVNNAAISPKDTISTLTENHFDKVININLKAPLFLSQHAIQHFRKKGSGTILNIGSINGYSGETTMLSYSISKGALMTLTRNLADSLAYENIRVNQINVGLTKVKRITHTPPKIFTPRGEKLEPEEIAQHALFWVSEQSSPATGVIYELEQYPFLGRNLMNRAQDNEKLSKMLLKKLKGLVR